MAYVLKCMIIHGIILILLQMECCLCTGLSICPSTIDKKFHQEEEGAFSDTVFHTTLLNIVPWVSFIEEQWSSQSSCSFYSSVPVVLTLLLPDSH